MTYTFKLARRLAVSRNFLVLTALALLAACMGDTTAPDAVSPGSASNPVSLQVVPRSVTIETNQRVRFRGQTRNARGERVSTTVAWGATGGSINADGTFSSTLTGTFKVIGRGRGWRHTDTSVVTVVPPADLARLAVTPDSATLTAGTSAAFSATGYLADGTAVAAGVNWSATGGTIDPAGVYTADSTTGKFRVIATNTDGTLADTVTVNVTPPATPVLAGIVVSPVSVSLAVGALRRFAAYGRTSAGDSVPVTVAFKATGGTITSDGLYTAGQTPGTYKVFATSTSLADTAVVTVTPPTASSGTGLGIPFGPAQLPLSASAAAPFSLTITGTTASTIVGDLREARESKVRLVLNMTGGAHTLYMTDGAFDRSKWLARMDTYNTAEIRKAVSDAVADGTIVGESVMDEPHVSGGGDGNSWGPAGTMTKARVDSLCGYVKAMFPTLPVGVVHNHRSFEPTKSYRVCEFLVDAYSSRFGSVTEFRDAGLALGQRDGHAILFSMNVLNGGIQAARDGLWNCPLTTTGGRGTYDPNCRMTPQQIRDYGLVLGPAGCGMLMWRYNSSFMSDPANQQAFKDVASRLATLPAKACRRT